MKKTLLILSGLAAAGGLGYYFLVTPKIKVLKIDTVNRVVKYSFGSKEGTYDAKTDLGTAIPGRGAFEMWVEASTSLTGKKTLTFVVRRGTTIVTRAQMINFEGAGNSNEI